MISYKDLKEVWSDIKHDKTMKVVARIFVICVCLAFIITFVLFLIDGSRGKHVRYLGLWERNIPKGYPDTVKVASLIHDTVYKSKASTTAPKKEIPIGQKVQHNLNGKNEQNEVKGDNYGTVGGENNTVNNFGVKPRELTTDVIKKIIDQIPSKETPISIYRRTSDSETYSFSTKILKALQANGYQDVVIGGVVNEVVYNSNPDNALKRQTEIVYERRGDEFIITVPSNK